MERFNNDIENFFRQELEDTTLTPPPHIWQNIHQHFHSYFTWYVSLFLFCFLLIPLQIIRNQFNWLAQLPKIASIVSTSNSSTVALTTNSQISIVRKQVVSQNQIQPSSAIINDNITQTKVDEFKPPFEGLATVSCSLYPFEHTEATIDATKHKLAVNTYQKKNKEAEATINSTSSKSKPQTGWYYTVYATPSSSFRKISDDKIRYQTYRSIFRNNPDYQNVMNANINSYINAKPGAGIELGLQVGYAFKNKIHVSVGLQYSKQTYLLSAYKINATNTALFIVKNSKLDSVTAQTSWSTYGRPDQEITLHNSTQQIAIPIQVEYNLFNAKQFGVSVYGNIQPNFVLSDNSHIVSTNYKYFVQKSEWVNMFHLQTAIGCQFSYTPTNSTSSFYLAPQFKYQATNSFNSVYPIQENRYDWGLQLGFRKYLLK